MSPDLQRLTRRISTVTGLPFESVTGKERGKAWAVLQPVGHRPTYSFRIRAFRQWTKLDISFEPGKFAKDLLTAMGRVDQAGRTNFSAILSACERDGAQIDFQVNGQSYPVTGEEVWECHWERLVLKLTKRDENLSDDEGILEDWTARFAEVVAAIVPREAEVEEDELQGYPEGAKEQKTVNKYERDPRNRERVIDLKGAVCQGCGFEFEKVYGQMAKGIIDVHHTTPVSQLSEKNYCINLEKDLVPLCPNCHRVVHRRNPPLTVEELRQILKNR